MGGPILILLFPCLPTFPVPTQEKAGNPTGVVGMGLVGEGPAVSSGA